MVLSLAHGLEPYDMHALVTLAISSEHSKQLRQTGVDLFVLPVKLFVSAGRLRESHGSDA